MPSLALSWTLLPAALTRDSVERPPALLHPRALAEGPHVTSVRALASSLHNCDAPTGTMLACMRRFPDSERRPPFRGKSYKGTRSNEGGNARNDAE